MQLLVSGLKKIFEGISNIVMSASAVITLAIAIIGTIDVLTTSLIKKPIPGAAELSQAGLALLLFFGLAVGARTGAHIKVDILIERMNERGQNICSAIGYLFTAVFFMLWAHQLWLLALKSWSIREIALGLLKFPIYPVKIAIFLSMVVATLETIRQFIFSVISLSKK